jgi:hypothetical protein
MGGEDDRGRLTDVAATKAPTTCCGERRPRKNSNAWPPAPDYLGPIDPELEAGAA